MYIYIHIYIYIYNFHGNMLQTIAKLSTGKMGKAKVSRARGLTFGRGETCVSVCALFVWCGGKVSRAQG